MGMMLEKLVLLSLIRAICLWILPPGSASVIADQGLRMITLATLIGHFSTLWEGMAW